MAEQTEKKTFVDELLSIASEHPVGTGILVGVGIVYMSAKLQEHLTYKAVLRANVDGYKTIMDMH